MRKSKPFNDLTLEELGKLPSKEEDLWAMELEENIVERLEEPYPSLRKGPSVEEKLRRYRLGCLQRYPNYHLYEEMDNYAYGCIDDELMTTFFVRPRRKNKHSRTFTRYWVPTRSNTPKPSGRAAHANSVNYPTKVQEPSVNVQERPPVKRRLVEDLPACTSFDDANFAVPPLPPSKIQKHGMKSNTKNSAKTCKIVDSNKSAMRKKTYKKTASSHAQVSCDISNNQPYGNASGLNILSAPYTTYLTTMVQRRITEAFNGRSPFCRALDMERDHNNNYKATTNTENVN